MFPTGSKLFYGLAGLSLVAFVVYGTTQSWGSLGSVGLASAMVAFGFLAAIASFTRDSSVSAMDEAAIATAAAARPASRQSLWPVVAGLGAGLTVLGLVTDSRFFVGGLAAVGAAAVQWLVQGWAEYASGDQRFNARIRGRMAHPWELPILGAAGLGVVIFAFSRVMLAADKEVGTALFVVMGAVILAFGFVFSAFAHLRKAIVGGILAVGAVLLVAAGIASAVRGERPELAKHGEELAERDCGVEEGHTDEHAPAAVAAKANVHARVVLTEAGLESFKLSRRVEVFTFTRSNPTNIVFRNETSEPRRIVVHAGAEQVDVGGDTVDRPIEYCTYMVGEDQESFVTVNFPKPSVYGDAEFFIEVPGVDGARVEIVVP
jgi:hypothetical protein